MKETFRKDQTWRLALSYLAVIMALSLSFSFILYRLSAGEVERQVPPDTIYQRRLEPAIRTGISEFLHDRINESRHILLARLVLLNLFVLAGGAFISYYLARLSLEPIEEAMEQQSRFASDASHELRTPLTAIRARNEVALRNDKLSLTQARATIRSNLDEVIKLEQLSQGLLKLAHENGKPYKTKPVDLSQVASRAVNNLLSTAQAKKMKIEDTVTKLQVQADEDSLTQAVSVLLDNAIKYSQAGGTIHLSSAKSGKQASLSVRDEGVGISSKDLPHIFERFYRADNARNKSAGQGYGLGLSIAKQIIEQHGGQLSVKSRPGKGSTFTINLPT